MTLDFPTFERPKKATVGRDGCGSPSDPTTPFMNCAEVISMISNYDTIGSGSIPVGFCFTGSGVMFMAAATPSSTVKRNGT